MWITDADEAETFDGLARKLGEFHADTNRNGDPVVKYLYNDEIEQPDDLRLKLQNKATEWAVYFKDITNQDRDYTQEKVNNYIYGGF